MFRNRPSASTTTGAGSGAAAAATAIQGSIRPPPSNDSANPFTRQQHLDSYLMDDTLSKSTRRVSTGTTFFVSSLCIFIVGRRAGSHPG
jgi:hypothetical protein